jgi:hypothetical protein
MVMMHGKRRRSKDKTAVGEELEGIEAANDHVEVGGHKDLHTPLQGQIPVDLLASELGDTRFEEVFEEDLESLGQKVD